MDNTPALAAFITHQGNIEKLLSQLTNLSADHFGYSPDEINWSHVGRLASLQNELDILAQQAGLDTDEILDSE